MDLIPLKNKKDDSGLQLTGRAILSKGHVIEAENLHYIIEVRMLNSQVPRSIVFMYIQIHDRDLDPPIVFIALFDMPMHMNRTHMTRAIH